MIRTLLFSTLFPNSVRPNHGIFVETRLRQLLSRGEIEARVVAPVPWFPFRHRVFGEYACHGAVPRVESINGVAVEHPRYLLLPKVGMNSAPKALARTGLAAARRLIASGYDFDLIDAHYFYPDGVAAAMIGKALGKPVLITARGSDINLIPRFDKPRQMILEAANNCSAIIAVSSSLKDAMVRLGVDDKKINVLRNGVDLELFHPEERAVARSSLQLSGFGIASVGNLVVLKGHDLVIQAMPSIPDATLFIVGRGSEDRRLKDLAARLGVGDRVRFLGVLAQSDLRRIYSAVDCMTMLSEREGWPNVLLEAMACGTPVLATRVGGVPEIVTGPEAGLILEERTADALLSAIRRFRMDPPTRDSTRAYAERFGWEATTEGQLSLFKKLLENETGPRHA